MTPDVGTDVLRKKKAFSVHELMPLRYLMWNIRFTNVDAVITQVFNKMGTTSS